jgi:hypothetical protein
MLIRFLKHTPIEWKEDSHSWYAEGDCAVATIRKQDINGVWLLIHSDDDMLCIVTSDSFEVIEDVKVWDGPAPQKCEICNDVHVENHFFCVRDKIMCINCFNLLDYQLVKPFLEDNTASR